MPIPTLHSVGECIRFLNQGGPDRVAKFFRGGQAGTVDGALRKTIDDYLKSDEFKKLLDDNLATYGGWVTHLHDPNHEEEEDGRLKYEVVFFSDDGQDLVFDFCVVPPAQAGGLHVFYRDYEDAEGWHTPSLDDKGGTLARICGKCGLEVQSHGRAGGQAPGRCGLRAAGGAREGI